MGGWNPKFFSQNPPPEQLEMWAEKEARFNLMLAGSLPHVVMDEPKITRRPAGVWSKRRSSSAKSKKDSRGCLIHENPRRFLGGELQ